MKEHSHEPSALIRCICFCETVSVDLAQAQAMSLREKLAGAEDDAESKHAEKKAKMASKPSKGSGDSVAQVA